MKPIKKNTITVEDFYTTYAGELELRLTAGADGLKRIIREPAVNRPGLILAGFKKYFAYKRVQVLGNAETHFLRSLDDAGRTAVYDQFFGHRIPCVVFARNARPDKLFLKMAEDAGVPVFVCPLITMKFINQATLALETLAAPRGSEMGSMVDILGVGVIIKGESGIGKSECVLELIERGYSLVSDDITRLILMDGHRIIGTSPDMTRDHMEVRGIGIINVSRMFGIKGIRREKELDLVVSLRSWEQMEDVDRLGIEEERVTVLGIAIPHITIPVRPGRNLARLVEVAALQVKLRGTGYNAAQDLNDRLIAQMQSEAAR